MKELQTPISFKNVQDAFYVYCDIVERHGRGATGSSIASFYIGCVILQSFACEIGLKALLASENKVAHGHYLDDLFNELSTQKQNIIRQCTEYDRVSFNESLSANKDHFTKWRYYYEGNSLSVDYQFTSKLFYAIKACLDGIKPKH